MMFRARKEANVNTSEPSSKMTNGQQANLDTDQWADLSTEKQQYCTPTYSASRYVGITRTWNSLCSKWSSSASSLFRNYFWKTGARDLNPAWSKEEGARTAQWKIAFWKQHVNSIICPKRKTWLLLFSGTYDSTFFKTSCLPHYPLFIPNFQNIANKG